MKAAELNTKSAAELSAVLLKLREDQFKLRMQKATQQLTQSHLITLNRKNIARVKTMLAQKQAGE